MPIVRLREGADAPFLACWLDDLERSATSWPPQRDSVAEALPHLAEGGISATLSSSSQRHAHAHGHVLAYIGSELGACFTINLRGSCSALDAVRLGIAVEVHYSGQEAPLRFNCRLHGYTSDEPEWEQRVSKSEPAV